MEELGKGDLREYVELPDDDHGLTRYRSTIRHRIDFVEHFLGRHLRLPDLAPD
jgi:hypothetical protein